MLLQWIALYSTVLQCIALQYIAHCYDIALLYSHRLCSTLLSQHSHTPHPSQTPHPCTAPQCSTAKVLLSSQSLQSLQWALSQTCTACAHSLFTTASNISSGDHPNGITIIRLTHYLCLLLHLILRQPKAWTQHNCKQSRHQINSCEKSHNLSFVT